MKTAIAAMGLAVTGVATAAMAEDIQSLGGEWIKINGPSRPDQPGIGAYLEFQPQSSRVVLSWSPPAKFNSANGKYGADFVWNNEMQSCWYAATRSGTKLILRLVKGEPPGVCLEDSVFELRQPPGSSAQSRAPAPRTDSGRRHMPAPTSASAVCASSGDARYCASSVLPTSGINIAHYGPRNLFDGDDSTAWVENIDGDGVGEWIVLSWPSARSLAGIRITNGYAKSTSLFASNGRVRRMEVSFSNGETTNIIMQDTMNSQLIRFSRQIETTWIKATIMETIRGTKYRDTAISEFVPIFE